MLATCMRRMRNDNLEIRIAGSCCRPQLENFFMTLKTCFPQTFYSVCFCPLLFIRLKLTLRVSLLKLPKTLLLSSLCHPSEKHVFLRHFTVFVFVPYYLLGSN